MHAIIVHATLVTKLTIKNLLTFMTFKDMFIVVPLAFWRELLLLLLFIFKFGNPIFKGEITFLHIDF